MTGPPSKPQSEPSGHIWAWGALALVCGASILTLSILGTRLTFFNDDWFFLLQRPGLEGTSIFLPHNGQLVAGVDLSYKTLVELWGFDQLPFRLLLCSAVAALGVVIYLLVSQRAGALLGLVAATLIVFLGPAWEILLFPASIGPVVALAAGLVALLLLQDDTVRRNVAACLLLVVAVAFSGVGLAFVAAAAVAVMLRKRPVQLWIPGAPAAMYGVWLLTEGGDATSDISLSNLDDLPKYILDSASMGLASITGLNQGGHYLLQAHLLVALAAIGIVVWALRGGRPSRQLAVFVTAALAFWTTTGLGFVPGREPWASRYQLISAALVVVIAAEMLRPVRLRGWQYAPVVLIAALALASNLERLNDGYLVLSDHSKYAQTDLGALEMARGQALADVRLVGPVAHNDFLNGITSERYYEETDEHGEMAHFSADQIAAAHPRLQLAADSVLAAAYAMHVVDDDPGRALEHCSRLAPRSAEGDGVVVPPGGVVSLENVGAEPLAIEVRRFAPAGLSTPVGELAPAAAGTVTFPRDLDPHPWRLTAQGKSPLMICTSA